LAVNVLAQEKVVPLHDFSGGLNTIASDFSIQPNECRLANNIDFSRNLGALTKRWGYDSIATKSATDSFRGMLGITWEDGTSQLVVATDDSAKGYGGIYLLPKSSVKLDSAQRIWDYWSAQGQTNFLVFQDRLYGVNGYQKGFVYERQGETDIVRSLPIQAPGEPLITPISCSDTATYKLSGEYRYTFRVKAESANVWVTRTTGYIAGPVKINGRAVIRFAPFAQQDTTQYPYDVTDSVRWQVWRTKANPGRLDKLDKFYRVGYGDTTSIGGTSFASKIFIDSVPDSLLSSTDTFSVDAIDAYVGRDSLKVNVNYRYGAPGFKSCSSAVYTGALDSAKTHGVFFGLPYCTDSSKYEKYIYAVAYSVTFFDSLLNMESDTGRSLFVYDDSGTLPIRKIRVSMPKRPDSVTNLHLRLYRAHLMAVARDTNILLLEGDNSILDIIKIRKMFGKPYTLGNPPPETFVSWNDATKHWKLFLKALVNDTIMLGPYHLLAQLPGNTALFTDSVRYDSLVKNPIFHRSVPPPLLKYLFSYDNRVIGFAGSGEHWSFPDTGGAWGTFASVEINPGDGEQIEASFPARNVIRIMKSRSSWNLYQDANLEWSLTEVAARTGCIATNSYQRGAGGHYYFSEYGVIQENEGQYLDRTQQAGLISSKLKNFDALPITTKRTAKSFYIDQTYLLNIGDTTYAFFEKAGAWATWTNFKIGGATLFRKASQVDFIAPDTMYFYKPNGKTLFRYKSSESDNGAEILWQWKSALLLTSPTWKQITGFVLYSESDTGTVLPSVITNQDGDTLGGVGVHISDSLSNYIRFKGAPSSLGGYGFSIMPYHNTPKRLVIHGIDVYYTEHGIGLQRK